MKVTLIFTPNQLNLNFKELAFRDDNIGSVPPLSLLYVASILENAGVEVDLIDMAAEQLDYSRALQRINNFSPDLLGFSITTISFHPVLKWINRFKKDTGLPVLVGGEHVRLYPFETMSHSAIDFCIVGEADLPLPQFISAFQKKLPFDGIKSLGFRKSGTVIIDQTLQGIANIDLAPFPARHLIKNELYDNVFTRHKNFTAMLSARGCPFNCAFCNANQQKYRARSPINLVDEIELNLTKHGIRDFDIYDSTFTTDRNRVFAICEEIRKRKLDVGFSVRSRVDVVSKEMIDSLKSAGCHTIMYGIESSNPEILKRMNKGISTEQVIETVTYTSNSRIETLGFFMFGFPGETEQTIKDTIEFSLKLPLDYAQFTLLVPFPETEIYAYYREHGVEDYWAEYTLDESKERLIDLIDTEVTREAVSEYVAEAYRRFYYRPEILWTQLKSIRSFSKLKNLSIAALDILANTIVKKQV